MRIRKRKYLTGAGAVLGTMLLSTNAIAAEDSGFDALSDPLPNLTAEEDQAFIDGLEVFERNFGNGPVAGGDFGVSNGGGPMRNTFGPNSCVACHGQAVDTLSDEENPPFAVKDGAGHGAFTASQATAYNDPDGYPGTGDETCDHLGDRGGPGFQIDLGLNPSSPFAPKTGIFALGLSPLAQEATGPNTAFGGEYVPTKSKDGYDVGPLDRRTTNDLFGLGLLDALADWKISWREDPYDSNGDGISGRVHWITDHDGIKHVGKFGRRSEVHFLDEFNFEAFQNEQGVTNDEFTDDGVLVTGYDPAYGTDPQYLVTTDLNLDCDVDFANPPAQVIPACAMGEEGYPNPEVSHDEMEDLNAYVRFLAQPKQNTATMSWWNRFRGKLKFYTTGCAACHTPAMFTGWNESSALRWKLIQPYSDLLLHDMGEELNVDGGLDLVEGCKGDAAPNEWRTEPLWGLRFVPAGYMHDGASDTIEDAIARHGGEASTSRTNYNNLSNYSRNLLLDFLNTL